MDDDASALSRRRLLQISATSLASARTAAAGAGVLLAETATPADAAPAAMINVENYILQRLSQSNVKALFGISGATCSPIFEAAQRDPSVVAPVITSTDLAAGQAADGYARMRGLGAVAVTYGVGTMSLLATVAGAYAERSPLVVINGGPSKNDLDGQNRFGILFSHSFGHTQGDFLLFKEVTEYAARAEKASDVPGIVDKALTIARTKQRPVYIEIAKDVWRMKCLAPTAPLNVAIAPSGNETQLANDIMTALRHATKPVLILGIEIQRYGLTAKAVALANKLRIPWTTTLLGKSVIPETTPGFAGVYNGDNAAPAIVATVEGANAVLALGCVWGRQYNRFVRNANAKIWLAFNGAVKIGNTSKAASLSALLDALQAQAWTNASPAPGLPGLTFDQRRAALPPRPANPEPGLTYEEVLRSVSNALDANTIAITDTSLSMYAVGDLNTVGANAFLCNAVWQFIGYSIGATIGVGLAQARRPIAICGDAGFQITAAGLSSIVREKVNAIVILLDNGFQGIEQFLLHSHYFVDPAAKPAEFLTSSRWNYADLAKSMGFAFTRTVDTASAFQQALDDARAGSGPAFICVAIKPHDLPPGLPTT
jgi:indolepyruvate decarboxylase